jgi:hypothetical protein
LSAKLRSNTGTFAAATAIVAVAYSCTVALTGARKTQRVDIVLAKVF